MNPDATNFESPLDPPDATTQFQRFRVFIARTLRFWWIVGLTMVVGVLACAVFFFVRTPHYRSETVLLYSEGIRPTDEPGTPAIDRNAGVRLREMLYARPRLEKIIRKFDLYRDIRERYGVVDAVDEFREDIGFRAPGSDTYTISYEGTSPEQARNVAAALAASLMEEESGLKRAKAVLTRDFLSREKERTEKTLKDAETGLAQFLADHPTFALDSMLLMPGALPTGAAIRAAETQNAAQASAGGARTTRVYRRSASGAPQAVDVPAIAVPEELSAERARAQAAFAAAQSDLAQKLARFTDQHPDVQAARGAAQRAQDRVEAVNAAIATAAAGAAGRAAATAPPSPAPRRVYAAAPKPKEEDAAQKQQSSDQLVALETKWSRLTRDVSEARARHDQMEASFFKADIAANSADGGHAVQMVIVDPAYLPMKTTPPGPITWVAIFVILSLLIGSGLAVGRAVIDDRVLDKIDLAGVAPVLTEIPRERRPRGMRLRRPQWQT